MAKKASRPAKATKLPPTEPEARDEGPRLLPLIDEHPLVPQIVKDRNSRYIELADILLGNKKPKR